MLFNIALSLVLIRAFGYPDSTDFAHGPFGGLALAMSIATALESVTLWVILRRRIGSLGEMRVLGGAARTLVASLVMAAAAGGFLWALPDLRVVFRVGGAMALGAVVFWGVALALRVDEATLFPRMVLSIDWLRVWVQIHLRTLRLY